MINKIRKIYLNENDFIKISNKDHLILTSVNKAADDWLDNTLGIVFLLKMKGVYMNLYTLFKLDSYGRNQDGSYTIWIKKLTEPIIDKYHIVECA